MKHSTISNFQEDSITFLILFILYLSLGVYLTQFREFLPGDAMARMVSAWLVFQGTEQKLATIGFVWPPIPTLFILPLTLIPAIVKTWLAPVIVSATSMAVAGVAIQQIGRLCNLKRGWRYLLVLLFATNPMILSFGANGMSEAVLIAFTLHGFYWLIRFWENDRNTHLILCGLFMGFLPLIRYEVLLITVAVGLLIFAHSWATHSHLSLDDLRNFLEGRLLAYASLVVYPIFIWMLVNWQIMGSPIYFISNPQSALNIAETQISSFIDTRFFGAMALGFRLWIEPFPLAIVLTIAVFFYGVWRKSAFLIGLALIQLITPVFQGLLINQSASVPLVRYYIIGIPLAIVAFLAAWKDFTALYPDLNSRVVWSKAGILTTMIVIFALSGFSANRTLLTSKFQSIENPTWVGLSTKEPIPYTHFKQPGEGLKIGRVLPGLIPEGSRVLLDTYSGGYAIILASGNPKLFLDFTDPDYEKAVISPWEYADYVLVASNDTEARLSAVNRAHPDLHSLGATWAELVDELPATIYDWRLYRIIPPSDQTKVNP
jgi:hypothetical protein